MPAIFPPLTRLKRKLLQLPAYQRRAGYCLAAYLGYAIILGLLTPAVALRVLPAQLAELTGRPVSLEDIGINPFTLEFELSGLGIQEADSSAFTGFERLEFQLGFWHSLVNGAISLADIHMTAPYANIRHLGSSADGQNEFNFSDIVTRLMSATPENEPQAAPQREADAGLPHLLITEVAITDADISFVDRPTRTRLHYPDIDIRLKQFDSHASMGDTSDSNPNRFSVHILGSDAGEIATQGRFQLTPLAVSGELQLAGVQLGSLWPFVAERVAARLETGHISLESQYHLSQETGRPLQLTTRGGQFVLQQLAFSHAGEDVVTLPLFALDDIKLNLLDRRVIIGGAQAQGLVLTTDIDKQGSSLLPLFRPTSAADSQGTDVTPADKTPAPEEKDWHLTLNGLNFENFDLHLTEHLVTEQATSWRLYPVALSTQTIDSELKTPLGYRLSLALNGQGNLSSQGEIDLAGKSVQADIDVSELALAQFQPFISPFINVSLKQGQFHTRGSLSTNAQGQARYRGTVDLDDLLVKDNLLDEPVLKWQKMHLDSLDFDSDRRKITLDRLSLDHPFARMVINEDRSSNIGSLVPDKDTESQQELRPNAEDTTEVSDTDTPAATEDKPFGLDIGEISIEQGSAFFADNSLTPHFATAIEQLQGSIRHLSSTPGTLASVDIQGKIDRYAPVTLKGKINPLLEQPYLDLALVFKSVELTSVNPYSGTYAGYYIDKGQLSLALEYRLEDNRLLGQNHLVVDQLELGKPSMSDLATSLPVTLAIALLQDRHGVIDLGLEVSGDLDSPSFSFGSIVLTAVTNVITKAVSAPFSLLASLVGADESLDSVAFSPGDATIGENERQKLAKLAKALDDRPMLRLSIEGNVDPILDSRALAEQRVADKLAQRAGMDTAISTTLSASTLPAEGPLIDALLAIYGVELGADATAIRTEIAERHQGAEALGSDDLTTRWHMALYNLLVNAQQIEASHLGQLAQARARAVKANLVNINQTAPQHVFLLDSTKNIDRGSTQARLTLSAE